MNAGWNRTSWRKGLLVVGCVLFAVMLLSAGLDRVAASVASMGFGMLLVLAAPAVGMALHATGWRLLFDREHRPGWWASLRVYVAAQALDELGAGVMGEPLKAVAVRGTAAGAGLRTMLMDNMAQVAALALFLAAGAGVLALGDDFGLPFGHLLLAAFVLLGGCVGLAFLLLAAPERIVWVAGRFPLPRAAREFLDRQRDLGRRNREFLGQHRLRFAGCILLHAAGKGWIVAEMALALALLGVRDVGAALWLGLGSAAASVVGAPVPGQIGAVEGTLAGLGAALAIAPPTVMALALARRVRGLVWIGVGLVLAGGAKR